MALFENYEGRMPQLQPVLEKYGFKDFDELKAYNNSKGVDAYKIVEGIQPICFENAKWAYEMGAAIALKKGVKTAAEAATCIGEGLQAFCIPGSVADQRQVGLGHGNLGAMLLSKIALSIETEARGGSIDKAAGIDDHQIGASVGFRRFVAFGAQLGQDLFGIDQRFRAAERDKAHFWRRTWHGLHGLGLGGRNGNTVNFRHSWQLVKW